MSEEPYYIDNDEFRVSKKEEHEENNGRKHFLRGYLIENKLNGLTFKLGIGEHYDTSRKMGLMQIELEYGKDDIKNSYNLECKCDLSEDKNNVVSLRNVFRNVMSSKKKKQSKSEDFENEARNALLLEGVLKLVKDEVYTVPEEVRLVRREEKEKRRQEKIKADKIRKEEEALAKIEAEKKRKLTESKNALSVSAMASIFKRKSNQK